MSSPSRTSSKSDLLDAIVIGPAWAACWGALSARHRGLNAAALVIPEPRAPETLTAHLGNGEWRPRAEQAMGAALVAALWDLSAENFRCFKKVLALSGVGADESGLKWRDKPDVPSESALVARRVPLEQYLAAQVGAQAKTARWDWRITRKGSFEYEVDGWRARTVWLVGDRFRPEPFPFLGDKWIPCTLSSFRWKTGKVPPGAVFLFHGGADFAYRESEWLRVGSFRNLFEDRGVGFHDRPDEVTRKNCEAFFRGLGWIATGEPESFLEIGTVTCDGLPLIGPLPEEPGVFLAGGFAARGAHFLFAVLEKLADALAGQGPVRGLDPFTTKRFA